MPHRAGYFVLAYSWDHHCSRLYDALEGKFLHVSRELSELETARADGAEPLLNYYKKWHYNNQLYRLTMADVERRRFTINSLGYRGYGVNKDLLAALDRLVETYGGLEGSLQKHFRKAAGAVRAAIGLSRHVLDSQDSREIIAGLCKKLGLDLDGQVPVVRAGNSLDLAHYWQVMSQETPFHVNTAIFQRMFFFAARSSMTIMKGSTGLHDWHSSQDLKLAANRDFLETGRQVFVDLSLYTEINMELLRGLHHSLMKSLDPKAGSFRQIDFPDRNGVTFEFDNFYREVSDLSMVLAETARSFHDLDEFIYNLARSYYMFMGIHPFWDGNGRVGRCFLNLLLMKKGLPSVVLDDEEEVLSLPRYGGSMEDMHNYLRERLREATHHYFYERWKLEAFGLFGRHMGNAAFDSGVLFRQVDERPWRIEVQFEAFVADDDLVGHVLRDQSKIAFPESRLLYDMRIYCGFCDAPSMEWRYRFSLKNNFYIKELSPARDNLRVFDVDFVVEIPWQVQAGEYFAFSVACDESPLVFNNKGLNYTYRLEL